MTDSRFAVVHRGNSAWDIPAVARLLAEPLEAMVADLVGLLCHRSGIFAEDLFEYLADRCCALLRHSGIDVQVVPQSQVVELPPVATLSFARFEEDVWLFKSPEYKGVVPWREVAWVNFVSVQEPSLETFENWELSGDEGVTVRRFKDRRFVTKANVFVELVTRTPWLQMRIPSTGFPFADSGLSVFPKSRDNLLALAATLAERATCGRRGPGLNWFRSDAPRHEQRFQSRAIHEGFLRWQLTLGALDDARRSLS